MMLRKTLALMAAAMAFVPAVAIDHIYEMGVNYRGESDDDYVNDMCVLDVAAPADASGLPVVVWLHGGGLVAGKRELPTELLADSLVVIGVEYRFLPKASPDEVIDDAAAATAWAFANAEHFGGDPRKIFLAGHSAGGYLVDMIALDKKWLAAYGIDADSIAGVVPFSGQCVTHYEVRRLQGLPPLQPTIDAYAPLYHVRGDCPPMLIISADRNLELYGRYEEQAYFWRMLQLVKADAQLLELQGYNHGNMAYPAFPLLIQFIRERTR